jgi:hypothetical protein
MISGTVNIPAGNLRLYNAKVYIAQTPAPMDPSAPINLPAIVHGATCETCDQVVPPNAAASATTDINGNFSLSPVPFPPDGQAMYLVVQVGKWRRIVRIENQDSMNASATKITHCAATQLDPNVTRLPRTQSEGDIPRIAVSTGAADALECILRNGKLGLLDSEFTTVTGNGSVNMYAGNGADQFSAALGGAMFPAEVNTPALSWWDTQANWNQYDIVVLSCEGAQNLNTKSVTARTNLQNYIGAGGRVFASHQHNGWIQFGPAPLNTVATYCNPATNIALVPPADEDIVTTFPPGIILKQWLQNNNALTNMGQLAVNGGMNTIVSINAMLTQPWVTYQPPPNLIYQYFSFYAPVGAPAASQCGEMVFTDLHVSNGDASSAGTPFPGGCTTTGLTPQEKALIFLFFDSI